MGNKRTFEDAFQEPGATEADVKEEAKEEKMKVSISIKLSGDKRQKAPHHDPLADQQRILDEERSLSYEDYLQRKIREAYFFNMAQAQER